MYIRFKDGKPKVFTLSYDDGVVQDIRFIEILDKNGLKGTFNINTGLYLDEGSGREKFYGRMKLSEAKKLYINSGHEVAVHGVTHPFLEQLNSSEVISEVMNDRRNIEREFGTVARGMAYPFGTYSDEVIEVLKKCGICYARTTKSTGCFRLPENWLALHPTCHHNDEKLMDYATEFLENKAPWRRKLFYVWGHTYEFDNRENWEMFEEFAEYIGGHDNIWYATNIEIYDYVKAYESLQVSVDKKIVYNPSAFTVWFEDEGEVFSVDSGKTLYR